MLFSLPCRVCDSNLLIDMSLLLSVHICFSVDLGLPDLMISDFEPWTLVTCGQEKKHP